MRRPHKCPLRRLAGTSRSMVSEDSPCTRTGSYPAEQHQSGGRPRRPIPPACLAFVPKKAGSSRAASYFVHFCCSLDC